MKYTSRLRLRSIARLTTIPAICREIRFASGKTNALLENKVGFECATGGRLWSPNAQCITAQESERTKADKFRRSSRECKCCWGRAVKRTELIPRCIRSKEAANDYVGLRTRRMKVTYVSWRCWGEIKERKPFRWSVNWERAWHCTRWHEITERSIRRMQFCRYQVCSLLSRELVDE